MACGIRFVPATDLVSVRERGEDAGSPKFGIAIRASILILDDNGQETSKKDDGASSAARAAATKDVLLSRWNEGRPTILTTYLDDAEIEDLYGGGVFGRIFSDDRSKIVNFMRRQDVDR